jgi:hypothetical protein
MNFACATNLHCVESVPSFFNLRTNELSGCLFAMYCTGMHFIIINNLLRDILLIN